ncbi:MAG: glycoside hydrolase family 127 protein [Prevotellaceae bacterium]|jgi:DUF1680 family protein|nr:glycoside hydrolase family 127 protein [Prevotellaceae bacterium]
MLKFTLPALFLCTCTVASSAYAQTGSYPIKAVDLRHVELTDHFWLPKIETIQNKTIAYAFRKCEEEGRMENFVTAGDIIRGKTPRTPHVRGKMPFDDTDVYKIIEGAAYSLVNAPNPKLDAYLDSVIALIAYGQEPDGYLTTWRTIDPKNPPCNWVRHGGGRWFDLGSSHELYNAGHMYEAAAAHYQATGKRNFLDIALKNADLLVNVFMLHPQGNLHLESPGHEIIETGLIKLYQITGKKEYLQLSKHFLDNRSKLQPNNGAYNQNHRPVTEQDEVVGHAVRAVYLYAGMTDIAALYNDDAYRSAVNKLWDNMTLKKMYITGGLGARHDGEAFGDNYELPNLTAYAETCSAIGGVYWADRMFRLTGRADYFDTLERMLYNGVISGISLSGTEFFYPNPLESDGVYKFNQGACTRKSWFDCSCCPTNLIRFIPYIPNLIYATDKSSLYINLFVSNKAEIDVADGKIGISQQTNYPWNGKIDIALTEVTGAGKLSLKIRIPDWAENRIAGGDLMSQASGAYLYRFADDDASNSYTISVNGKKVSGLVKNGYFVLTRTWKKGDKVTLDLPMQVRTVEANPAVKDDAGKYAVERGPLVYCMEEVDNPKGFPAHTATPAFSVKWQPKLLNGINVIQEKTGGKNYRLIPYYAWSNRGVGKMKVWYEE